MRHVWAPEWAGRASGATGHLAQYAGGDRLSFSPTDGCTEEHALRDDLSIVEESDALVRNTLLVLTRLPAENPLGEAANEVARRLRPHLDDALAALGRIEQGRGLTETELARAA